jgi:hypothetical protein
MLRLFLRPKPKQAKLSEGDNGQRQSSRASTRFLLMQNSTCIMKFIEQLMGWLRYKGRKIIALA